jgi:hypothetical protein
MNLLANKQAEKQVADDFPEKPNASSSSDQREL